MNRKACLISCLGCSGLVMCLVLAMAAVAYQTFQGFKEGFANPEERAAELLADGETYPPEYEAIVAFGVPFTMDFIMLGKSQRALPTEDPFERFGTAFQSTDPSLVLMKMKSPMEDTDLQAFLKDGGQSSYRYPLFNVTFHADSQTARGFFERQGGEILYLSTEGRIVLSDEDQTTLNGHYSLFYSTCDDGRVVLGLWLDQAAAGAEDILGGAGDPQAFREQMKYFQFCP